MLEGNKKIRLSRYYLGQIRELESFIEVWEGSFRIEFVNDMSNLGQLIQDLNIFQVLNVIGTLNSIYFLFLVIFGFGFCMYRVKFLGYRFSLIMFNYY